MIDVVLCASGADEVRLVSLMSAELSQQLRVVRRCADLAEALGATDSGIGDVVIVDIDVPGLERATVHSFASNQVPVVALVSASSRKDPAQAGIGSVVTPHVGANELYGILVEAVASAQEESSLAVWEEPAAEADPRSALLAVWGPSGGPGRTLVASNVAWELARAGCETLLVDADTVGPCLSQVLGVIDDVPGLVSACRAVLKGTMTGDTFASLTPYVAEHLRLMSGIGVPSRWSELHTSALDRVLKDARACADAVVVDMASPLEASDATAPGRERNGAGLTVLENATHVLAVVNADPVSITRFIREGEHLRELTDAPVSAIVNRTNGAVSLGQIERSLRSRMNLAEVMSIPYDVGSVSRASWDGVLVCEASPRSESAKALHAIARAVHTTIVDPFLKAA